jgi:uncharacterized membrane protein
METELIVLRIGHILPGVLWIGTAIFMAVLLEPTLRALGPMVQGPVMAKLSGVLAPVMMGSAIVSIVLGFALVARTPGREFGDLFSGGWGQMIGAGIVTTAIAAISGMMIALSSKRLAIIGQSIEGAPSMEQITEMLGLQTRIRLLGRITAAAGAVALAVMSAARFA